MLKRIRRQAADCANYANGDLRFIRQRAGLHPRNSRNLRLAYILSGNVQAHPLFALLECARGEMDDFKRDLSDRHGRARIVDEIEGVGVVGVLRLKDAGRLRSVAEALAAGGVRAIEVTMTVPGAVRLIEELAGSLTGDFVLGAGTVLDAETARRVILAGAKFVVSPVFKTSVIEMGHRYEVPVIPGCFSPTEILSAWEAGADIVKVFPATALGPSFFKDIRGPLPELRLMPTGGVTRENAGDWIRAGAVAIGAGSALVDSKAVADGRLGVISANARHFVEAVQRARGLEAGR
jgi:2-dehydro-3-deoxyphosphogluconate aldolase/(4S)-4-hydroxy-2-oxoglutarate aldolase